MAPGNNRVIRMVAPNAASTGPIGPVKQEDIEHAWAKLVTTRDGILEAGGRLPFSVSMGGRGMDDAAIKRWCDWFESHYTKIAAGKELTAREVNFSNNQMTAAGISLVLKMLMRKNINVSILKLYQNQIARVEEVVEFLCWSSGNVKELHLSHNRLDTAAAHDVIFAAVIAKNAKDEPCYPRYGGYAKVPLWLRLEKNFINAEALDAQLNASFIRVGISPNRAICHVTGTTECNPGVCNACKGSVAAVHLTHITQQERSSNVPSIRALPTPQKTPGKSDPGVRTLPKASSAAPKAPSKPSRGWGQKEEPESEAKTPLADAEDASEAFPALQSFPALACIPIKTKEAKTPLADAEDASEAFPGLQSSPALESIPVKTKEETLPVRTEEEEAFPALESFPALASIPVKTKEETLPIKTEEETLESIPIKTKERDSSMEVAEDPPQRPPPPADAPPTEARQDATVGAQTGSPPPEKEEIAGDSSVGAATVEASPETKQDIVVADEFPDLSSLKFSGKAASKKSPSPMSQQVGAKPSFATLVKSSSASEKGDSTPCQVDSVSEFPSLPSAPEKKTKKKGSAKAEPQAKTSTKTSRPQKQEPELHSTTVVQSSGSEAAIEEATPVESSRDLIVQCEVQECTKDSDDDAVRDPQETSSGKCNEEQCSPSLEDQPVKSKFPQQNSSSSEDGTADVKHIEPEPARSEIVGKTTIVVNAYFAEAQGYLSVQRGDRIQALSDPVEGDVGCNWPSYVFCQTNTATALQGWLPKQALWELYYDEAGREWITDEALGEWRWVDELFP